MDLSREFLISRERLMELAMELAVLLHSHESLCRWLGSYELEEGDDDVLARYYKRYFEDRVGYLVLSLAILLRVLDDRKTISDYTRFEEPKQVGLGRIRKDGEWAEIGDLREVLNVLIHSRVVAGDEPSPVPLRSSIAGERPREGRKLSHVFTIVNDNRGKRDPESMELDLHRFCDIVFRIAEEV